MQKHAKTGQLQIRVTPAQKRAIQKQAERARASMSEWILNKLLPSSQVHFNDLLDELAASSKPSYVFAELLELIDSMNADEFVEVTSRAPEPRLDPYWQSYLAATLEHAAVLKHAKAPSWTREVPPLETPVFGSSLESLKLHLLVNSPPPFLARNIFIDASIGKRV
jgi:uncharacterized protein (DUF1778 family)